MTPHGSVAATGALAGLKVLDLSRFIAGPHCAMILGDLGASVVKVERVQGGDEVRALEPQMGGDSLYFQVFNRNKRSLTVDFRNPRAQDLLRRLVGRADVLIENFRAGTMEKMGLGWPEVHALNPRLVMARISGFGQQGPRAGEPCFDAIAQASSGLMSLTGSPDGPPMVAGTFLVDYSTSLYATIGVLSALQHRNASGEGQLVDLSLLGSGISLLLTAVPEQAEFGRTMTRVGNRDRYSAPAQTFRTRDRRWIYLLAGNDAHFPRLCRIMQRKDLLEDPRFATIPARMANVDAIEAIVGEWVGARDAAEVLRLTREAEVSCAEVATIDEIVRDPRIRAEGHITEVSHGREGPVTMQASPIRMSKTPAEVRLAAPRLGEHTEEILSEWLSLDPREIAALKDSRVV
ncbi:MAG TPA: CoA transferase [Roseiarcus sp.]|nr:CoA transferase [Roseiarcus sp.]